jgi:hypothetical protein
MHRLNYYIIIQYLHDYNIFLLSPVNYCKIFTNIKITLPDFNLKAQANPWESNCDRCAPPQKIPLKWKKAPTAKAASAFVFITEITAVQ